MEDKKEIYALTELKKKYNLFKKVDDKLLKHSKLIIEMNKKSVEDIKRLLKIADNLLNESRKLSNDRLIKKGEEAIKIGKKLKGKCEESLMKSKKHKCDIYKLINNRIYEENILFNNNFI